MSDSIPVPDPAPYRRRVGIVMETAAQVKKDLGLYSVDIRLSGNPESAYAELHEQLVPAIDRMLREEPELFHEMLYRIDVDEYRLKRILAEDSQSDQSSVYTSLIIEREFQKVVTRHYFSKNRLK